MGRSEPRPARGAPLGARRSAAVPALGIGAFFLFATFLVVHGSPSDGPSRAGGSAATAAAAGAAAAGPASAVPVVPPPELRAEEDEAAARAPATAAAALGWWKVNTHAHAVSGGVYTTRDDGLLPVNYWLDRYAIKGYDLLFFTPHSFKNRGAAGEARWVATRDALPKEKSSMTLALGAEVGVPKGPAWRRFEKADYIGNVHTHLNHIVVLGATKWIDPGLGAREVVEHAHATGGVAILAHPEIWEPGYWEAPESGLALDGLEVYNGLLMSVTDRDNAPLYRRAVSYAGLGMKLAAIGGSDTHKKKATASAATWFAAPAPEAALFVEAVRAHRTFATHDFDDLRVECEGMGEVRHTANVELEIRLDRVVDSIVLWRDEEVAWTWVNVAEADFSEKISTAAAYSWEVRDGDGRGYSSAIWYEPLRASR